MVKDRKNLLKLMYNGELNPNEIGVSGNPNYVAMSHQESEKIEYIASQLYYEDKGEV